MFNFTIESSCSSDEMLQDHPWLWGMCKHVVHGRGRFNQRLSAERGYSEVMVFRGKDEFLTAVKSLQEVPASQDWQLQNLFTVELVHFSSCNYQLIFRLVALADLLNVAVRIMLTEVNSQSIFSLMYS